MAAIGTDGRSGMTGQRRHERAAIERMGRALGPDILAAVRALYRDSQQVHVAAQPPRAADVPYGDHPRQVLDLYAPADPAAPAPVLLWVHGGGFVGGEKRSPDHPYSAHVGRWAARHGLLGAVMDYRLAPEAGWPAGGEDVLAAIDWLAANAAAYGGDAGRIVVAGTSAGAVHVATALQLRPDVRIAGAVLLSGLYGFTPLEDRDTVYFDVAAHHSERMPRAALVATATPLFVACAEFDPPRFQAETLGLLAARLDRHGAMPRAFIGTGHNHFSMSCHLGGADTRLADDLLAFIDSIAQPENTP